MVWRWYYSADADTVTELTDRVRLPISSGDGTPASVGSHAEEGSGAVVAIEVDDPDGDLLLLVHRRIYCTNDAAPAGQQVVGNWFIQDLDVVRMDPWDATARQWIVSMADENSLLERRIFVGTDSDREAETDIERILWALTTTELNVLSPDVTYIDQTDPVNLDAADYTLQKPSAILEHCKKASGKNYWVKYEETSDVGGAIVSSSVANPSVITMTTDHGLVTGMQVTIAGHTSVTPDINGTHTVTVTGATTFTIPVNVTDGGVGGTLSTVGRFVLCYFNANTSSLYPSASSLSNVAAEIDSLVVHAISDDTKLNRQGGRSPASGNVVSYPGGYEYEQDTDVGDTYVYRDVASPSINVKTAAAASAIAIRELAELDEPDDEVETEIFVDEVNVNDVMHGMYLPFHATHLPNFTEESDRPGYAIGTNVRVMRRQVRQMQPTKFGVRLWLSPMTPPPGVPQFYTSTNFSGCEVGTWTEGSPGDNKLLVGFLAQRDGSTSDATIVPIGNGVAPGSETCNAVLDIAGTEWTFIDNLTITNGAGQTGQLTLAYRDSAVGEPEVIRWGGAGGLAGTSRPRSHQIALAGFSGAPTVTQKGTCAMGATMTSPSITVGAAGRIFAGFLYRCTGPADGASPNISLAAQSPAVDLTQGWQYANFGGYSWFGYRDVAAAGSYTIALDRSGVPRSSHAAGWVMGFWPS